MEGKMKFFGFNKLIIPVFGIVLSTIIFYLYLSNGLMSREGDALFFIFYNLFMILWIMKIFLFPLVVTDNKSLRIVSFFRKDVTLLFSDIEIINNVVVSEGGDEKLNLKNLGLTKKGIKKLSNKINWGRNHAVA